MAEAMSRDTQVHWRDRKHVLWFPWTFTKYYITNERLMIEQGFFKTVVDETLLYRIVDITMEQTLAGKYLAQELLLSLQKLIRRRKSIWKTLQSPERSEQCFPTWWRPPAISGM